MKTLVSKEDKIVVLIVLLAFTAIFLYQKWRVNKIEADGVYVLAKVRAIHDSENGLIYSFKYFMDSVEYKSDMKTNPKMRDSTFVLKVSLRTPNLWMYTDEGWPTCINWNVNKYEHWKRLPSCK